MEVSQRGQLMDQGGEGVLVAFPNRLGTTGIKHQFVEEIVS